VYASRVIAEWPPSVLLWSAMLFVVSVREILSQSTAGLAANSDRRL
jgi:hypothetical protein